MCKIICCAAVMFSLLGFVGLAQAGQSGALVCVASHVENNGETSVVVCDVYELQVHITTDGDVGRPGAFGIGAQLANGNMAYWTATGGWQNSVSGETTSVDGYYQSLPASRDFVVYHGGLAGMCSFGAGFKIGAGYGALQPDKESEVATIVADPNVKISVDHLRNTLIRMDAMKGNKWGEVYSGGDCVASKSGGG
jgi:hypothetical protein